MQQDYFQFYEIPVSFEVDAAQLKKIYYRYSKKYHPDFHTLEDDTAQEAMLRLSSLNNEAYNTLRDFDKRMAYLLNLKGALNEEGQNKLPADFLMEMMEINEELMELPPDPHAPEREAMSQKIDALESDLYKEIVELVATYQGEEDTDLSPVANYYFKKKYLTRLRSQI